MIMTAVGKIKKTISISEENSSESAADGFDDVIATKEFLSLKARSGV